VTIGWLRRRGGVAVLVISGMAVPMIGQAAAGSSPLLYDVVSVKPDQSGTNNVSINMGGDQYKATNISLKMLIEYAWDLQTNEQIYGLTGWANSARFDLDAKLDAETLAVLKKLLRDDRRAQERAMMQAVLADRFQLRVHHEMKELPVYELTAAKGGIKLKEADPKEPNAGSTQSSNQKTTVTGVPMSSVTKYISQRVHRTVIDKTGLMGVYDFVLQWAPDEAAGEAASTAPSEFPPFIGALQEQLGLKLDSAKGPVDTLVVDHVEQPTEN
jgi:uncharacterized protein (TIGR03435 family)